MASVAKRDFYDPQKRRRFLVSVILKIPNGVVRFQLSFFFFHFFTKLKVFPFHFSLSPEHLSLLRSRLRFFAGAKTHLTIQIKRRCNSIGWSISTLFDLNCLLQRCRDSETEQRISRTLFANPLSLMATPRYTTPPWFHLPSNRIR